METSADWFSTLPALREMTDPAWLHAARSARLTNLPAGRRLFSSEEPCTDFFLVTHGLVRVQKTSDHGHAIVLYRLEPGQVCELTAAALLAGVPRAAEAVAETDLRVATLSKLRFRRLMGDSPQFRTYVYSALGKAVEDLTSLVEQLAFHPMDQRLARCLLARSDATGRYDGTHKALADELGSAREVISRLLAGFARRRWVRLHRGWIEILDRPALVGLAGEDPGDIVTERRS